MTTDAAVHAQLQALHDTVAQYRQALLSSLLMAAWMVEARDPYTGGHLWRVAQFAQHLSRAAGDSEEEATRIGIAAFLHDIGKIGVPDAVLRKPGKLDDEEFAHIRRHPSVGADMLRGHPLADLVRDGIYSHHEMPNGKGYPQALSGENVPRDARLIGICDAFDAMTSTRPYRAGMPIEKALGIIEENAGVQFDPVFAALFVRLGRSGQWDHIVGHSEDGIPMVQCPSCGPVITRNAQHHAGDEVACPACEGAFRFEEQNGHWQVKPLGRRADALLLQRPANDKVIGALLSRWKATAAAGLP